MSSFSLYISFFHLKLLTPILIFLVFMESSVMLDELSDHSPTVFYMILFGLFIFSPSLSDKSVTPLRMRSNCASSFSASCL